MKDTFTIGDREIEMAANAASPFIYGKIFNDDFENSAQDVDTWRKMTFVMVKQAEVGEMELYSGKLKEADFIDFLARFSPMDYSELMEKATDLYMRQQKHKSTPKNKAG